MSAALGMAAAREQEGHGRKTSFDIFGDAALTNGISAEALNNISHTTKKFIGILNDNEVEHRQKRRRDLRLSETGF